MKCVCGYVQENDFDLIRYGQISLDGKYARHIRYDGLYACPKCGTVKIKTKEEVHD